MAGDKEWHKLPKVVDNTETMELAAIRSSVTVPANTTLLIWLISFNNLFSSNINKAIAILMCIKKKTMKYENLNSVSLFVLWGRSRRSRNR